jgi:Uma2 family endonuclease
VRAVILEVDERMLAERQRLGLDRSDEMWEGVLHLVPPPKGRHQYLATELAAALGAPSRRAGCHVAVQIGIYAAADDYRIPDVAVVAPAADSERGVDGPPLVVIEIRSLNDESYEKVPWYLARGAASVVVIDQDRFSVEVFTSDGTVAADPDGLIPVPGLDVRMGAAPGATALVVQTAEGTHQLTG